MEDQRIHTIRDRDGEIKYRRIDGSSDVSEEEFRRDFARRDRDGEITDLVLERDSIIAAIELAESEQEVRRLTEKYTKCSGDSQAQYVIHMAGIAKWGTLVGAEGHAVAFEVRKNCAIDALIWEISSMPADGIFRTRDVITGAYSENVKIKGLYHGYRSAFQIIYRTGREIYGDSFTLEIAKDAFVASCRHKAAERYLKMVDKWFGELKGVEK